MNKIFTGLVFLLGLNSMTFAVAAPAAIINGKTAVSAAKSLSLPMPEKEWTILVYLNGNAENAMLAFPILNELERVGSTPDMNVVAQATLSHSVNNSKFGRRSGKGLDFSAIPLCVYLEYKEQQPDRRRFWEGTRRLYMLADGGKALRSIAVQKNVNANPATAKSMADFLAWGKKNFPARKYMLIGFGHGSGWQGTLIDTGKPNRELYPSELASALKKAGGVDLLFLESCLMQTVEVAYAMRGVTGAFAGYETPTQGIRLDRFLELMKDAPNASAAQAQEALFRAVEFTYSAKYVFSENFAIVRPDRLNRLSGAMAGLVRALRSADDMPALLSAYDKTPVVKNSINVDIKAFALNLAAASSDASVKSAAIAVCNAVDDSDVFPHRLARGNAAGAMNGLSVYMPPPTKWIDLNSYIRLNGAFVKDSGWSDLLVWMRTDPRSGGRIVERTEIED